MSITQAGLSKILTVFFQSDFLLCQWSNEMTDAYVCFAGRCRRSPKPSRHPGENRDIRLKCVLSKVSRAARDPGFHRDDGGVGAGFSPKLPLFEFVYRAADIISRKDAASHSPRLLPFRIHQLAQCGVDLGLVAARAALFCLEPVDHIGVQSQCDLLFERAIEFAAHSV
jgi:hypothetical protein